ncbi:hypothetical protein BBO99_00004522 [Phytophthora kernoviae]|uniref:BZIP domain-containing protein n=1 Tax=Phytophthora kernoviae TaxID=325452 RepID=A0A421GR79_9STRA|nr:hypothetical protein JM18_003837 [Phytophthora kernoviae]RLN15166.1 hypothetical protein BBI17_004714 [Phytophthora kernoviae]RLN80405.1 hypothetical protein BBO99_00004522 [Phytophthora kernoviae]
MEMFQQCPAPAPVSTLSKVGDVDAARRERHRYQCRVSQRRYRDKKGSAEYNLRLDVNSLRECVQQLRVLRELLETKVWSSRLARDGAVLKASEQYYTVFSNGLHNPDAGGESVRKCFDMQVGFVKAFMDKDVEFGDSKVRVVSSNVVGTEDAPIVVVKGLLIVRPNRTTIENMFPHILANEELVQVLLSQPIEYPTSTTYVFNACGQVERQDLDVDFLAGINRRLGSTYATSRVMQRALISDCCKLGQVTSSTNVGSDPNHAPTYMA